MQAIRTVQRTSFPKVASQARLLANQKQTPSFKFSSDSTISDFPKGKGVAETRTWLDAEGFEGKFLKWKADALLGADKEDILNIAEQSDEAVLQDGTRRSTILQSAMAKLPHDVALDDLPAERTDPL